MVVEFWIHFDPPTEEETKKIKDLLTERNEHRRRQRWEKADEIRQQIWDMGFRIEDEKDKIIIKRRLKWKDTRTSKEKNHEN